LIVARLKPLLLIAALIPIGGCSQSPTTSDVATSAQGRRLIQLPKNHPAAAISGEDLQHLKNSVKERRKYAWNIVAKVLSKNFVDSWELPAWSTWYGVDDFRRIFDKLFFDLGKEGRAGQKRLSLQTIEQAETWNTNAINEVWSEADYQKWKSSFDDVKQARGLSGLQRVYFDRPVLQHVIKNYPEIHKCRSHKVASPENRTECFDQEFPFDAAIVKAAWVRADADSSLPVYATDAQGLLRTFEAHHWVEQAERLQPSDDEIFVAKPSSNAPGYNKYWMPALHIMSKELPDWAWITLWWSDQPDADFGEDRPEFIRALGGPWSNYKMCIAVDYEDHASLDDLENEYPSLVAALKSAAHYTAPFAWCSNPYIEKGQSNHRTNCIGCHQHGGAGVRPDTVIKDEKNFPDGGRRRVRESFPADYLWSFGVGEVGFANFIEDTIKDYKNNDRSE
jgi:hypothetical protein